MTILNLIYNLVIIDLLFDLYKKIRVVVGTAKIKKNPLDCL